MKKTYGFSHRAGPRSKSAGSGCSFPLAAVTKIKLVYLPQRSYALGTGVIIAEAEGLRKTSGDFSAALEVVTDINSKTFDSGKA